MSTASNDTTPDSIYDDLIGQWADLESALAVLLTRPAQVQAFAHKMLQTDAWLQDLVAHDIDAALYLMFQLATTSVVGYSSSHALVCATLCHILARPLNLTDAERDSLVGAAFTMNIGMTHLQNELAVQREPLRAEQRNAIAIHPQRGSHMLAQLRITDALWLGVVARHHTPIPERTPLQRLDAPQRLIRILSTIDRYAAMFSPRKSRPGKSAAESVRSLMGDSDKAGDEVNQALIDTVGLCPPGTFVRLNNGETAIVLRRSEKANHPLVASVIDRHNQALRHPTLYHTERGDQIGVQAALARSAVSLELNHRTMVRLGLYAARRTRDLLQ